MANENDRFMYKVLIGVVLMAMFLGGPYLHDIGGYPALSHALSESSGLVGFFLVVYFLFA